MKRKTILAAVLLSSCGGTGGGTDEGGQAGAPPPYGGIVVVTVDPSQVLGIVSTTGGSNHTGLTAYGPADGLGLVPELQSIPYGLNRVHFFGNTPEGDNPDMLPQPAPASWNFGPLDKVVKVAVQLRQGGGPDFILAISFCPTWMTASGQPWTRPADDAVFAQYCERLVRYYNLGSFVDGTGATITNPGGVAGIQYWEIWNEPDITLYDPNDTPAFQPAEYAQTFLAASTAMRAADPTILIGGPNTSWNHQPYIDALAAAGAQLDFVSVHQYPGEPGESDAAIFAKPVTPAAVSSPLPLVVGELNALSDWVDPRMRSPFELAYMPLAYKAHIEAGTPRVIRWETVEDAFPVLNLDGSRHRTYWMERHFWSAVPPGATRVACSSSSPDVECLAAVAGGKLRVIVINRGVAGPADVNGTGVRYDLTVELSGGAYETVVVDRNTSASDGPASVSGASFTIDGYGMAVVGPP